MVRVDDERRRRRRQRAAEEQRERAVRRLELVALMLQLFDAGEYVAELRRVARHLESELPRLHDDVAPPGQVADEDMAAVADERRIQVLVAADHLLDRVDVRAA